ncbi:UNVERIFIED_CONTAM: hypothetical protein PYX00_010410 [Menopon gallinae]|uniref:DnaJ homolog subfamily C member 1 n=1 Tax=Menopon gallinae TaxID=328185 RepID=A0AAW2HFJ7_9NEOP
MALNLIHVCVFIVVVAKSSYPVNCWDSEELELFDLVEEVNQNFYTLLEVKQDADAKVIKKAFRNLSLILHPDKNDAPDAEIKFRQLVAVHEVLRDPAKRRRYDEVLENGLPDWRHAVYYYRRVRKMGLVEMLVILFIIVTIGQYAVGWAAYLEKKYIVEEFLTTHKKRLLKKQKKGKLDRDVPELVIEIPKPSVYNTLPFQIPKFLWISITSIPVSVKLLIEYCIERSKKKYEHESSEEEEEVEQETWVKGPRRRRNIAIPEIHEETKPNGGCILEPVDGPDSESDEQRPVSGGLWTDDDLSELIKLVNKYPPGTAKRWEKVAAVMGRSVSEVAHMAKRVKDGMAVRNDATEEVVEEPKKVKTKGGKHAGLEEAMHEKEWSQVQQKALEEALIKFPKQSAERWERIAKAVPGKTKEECMLRFKQLHDIVKKKKQSES